MKVGNRLLFAADSNGLIGIRNKETGKTKLPWHYKDDLSLFKSFTMNHTIIMGRVTWESLPKILPHRKHVVITRNKDYSVDDDRVTIVNSIYDAIVGDDNWIIGGAEIFELAINSKLVDGANVTWVPNAIVPDGFEGIYVDTKRLLAPFEHMDTYEKGELLHDIFDLQEEKVLN